MSTMLLTVRLEEETFKAMTDRPHGFDPRRSPFCFPRFLPLKLNGNRFDLLRCLQVRLNIGGKKTYQCESGRHRPDVGPSFPQ